MLFDTPITFPISWRKSKLDGVSGRLATTSLKGFQAQLTFGHTRARFFGPETGGLIFNSPVDYSVFRIDHDEAYEQTLNLHYQRSKNLPWIDFIWRYDSGAVAGNVPDLASALALTGDQQAAIGFYCGNQVATLTNPITSCSSSYGATRVVIPKAGTFNPDTNPPRIAPRNILDASVGTDNLLHTRAGPHDAQVLGSEPHQPGSLYNFLSTFSGTHFVTPAPLPGHPGYGILSRGSAHRHFHPVPVVPGAGCENQLGIVSYRPDTGPYEEISRCKRGGFAVSRYRGSHMCAIDQRQFRNSQGFCSGPLGRGRGGRVSRDREPGLPLR